MVKVLSRQLDDEVARMHIGKLGIVLTELTTKQCEYIGVEKSGPFKTDSYRY
jgi:adenosylhomocysteinase